jgi:hypothetical protein
VEDRIFLEATTNVVPSLDGVMELRRFQEIRSSLAFRDMDLSKDELKKDPASRIRPLISILKQTSPKYVDIGRNVSVDESTIACRSKYGRQLIVYNPKKPTGIMKGISLLV